MKHICIDACFMIALYDNRDRYHSRAETYFNQYFTPIENALVVPWPILYETVSTRLVRSQTKVTMLRNDWRKLAADEKLILLDDNDYREKALEICFSEVDRPSSHYRYISLVDHVLRQILSKPNLRIDLFITFNQRDFYDICRKYGRIMIGET